MLRKGVSSSTGTTLITVRTKRVAPSGAKDGGAEESHANPPRHDGQAEGDDQSQRLRRRRPSDTVPTQQDRSRRRRREFLGLYKTPTPREAPFGEIKVY